MRPWLRVALAVQVVFFAGWGVMLLRSHRDADVVWLATVPVDPRDLLSGHYVALRYSIESPAAATCNVGMGRRPVTVYVRVARGEGTVRTAEGEVAIWEAVACQEEVPDAIPGARWIAGRLADRDRIAYGIERFYVTETSALRSASSGSVVAKVAVSAAWEARILDLVPIVASPR